MSRANYFASGVDARRYSQARPAVHRTAVETFQVLAGAEGPFARALDVGCGTGQSSVALAAIAESVIGVDASAEMLAERTPHPRIHYQQASAEQLPFAAGVFDLIAVGLAFHWFDASAFLTEVRRVLRPSGWLLIYTSRFTGEMLENVAFADWFRDEFLIRYPTPSRNLTPIGPALAEAHGLVWVGELSFSNDIAMSVETFLDYQLSTTNIIAAGERGSRAFNAARTWMRASLASLFGTRETGTFRFVGKAWCLRRLAAEARS